MKRFVDQEQCEGGALSFPLRLPSCACSSYPSNENAKQGRLCCPWAMRLGIIRRLTNQETSKSRQRAPRQLHELSNQARELNWLKKTSLFVAAPSCLLALNCLCVSGLFPGDRVRTTNFGRVYAGKAADGVFGGKIRMFLSDV